MIIKILYAMIFSAILLTGSIPLGFSEPLRVQLEQGITIDQLQCSNDSHVLVMRDNGNYACVTERTAEKLGWEIIQTIPTIKQINYEYPLTKSNDLVSKGSSEPIDYTQLTSEMKISKLPNIGETAEITMIVSDANYRSYHETLPYGFAISSNFEFVDIPQEKIEHRVFNDYWSSVDEYEVANAGMMPRLVSGETFEFTFKVKAVAENLDGYITASILGTDAEYIFYISVLQDQTILREDYDRLYPQPQQNTVDTFGQGPSDGKSSPGTKTTFGTTEDPVMTEEEYIEYLKRNGYSDEEIEEKIIEYREAFSPASTQSFFLPSAYAASPITVQGTFSIDNSYLSPDKEIGINGAKVCVQEENKLKHQWTTLYCNYTDEDGKYLFLNVGAPSGSGSDGTLDVRLQFTSDSLHSVVNKYTFTVTSTNPRATTEVFGNPYQIFSEVENNKLNSFDIDHKIQNVDTVTSPNPNRAFWIIDAISDAWDISNTKMDIQSSKVNVAWQFDSLTPLDGAYYIDSSDYIFLNGEITLRNSQDDSFERYVIIHEWGHHMMSSSYGNNLKPMGNNALCDPNDIDGDGSRNDHSINSPVDNSTQGLQCAWREAWGDILPSLVDDESVYPRSPTITYDFEESKIIENNIATSTTTRTPTHVTIFDNKTSANVMQGQIIEGRIASAIWDIFDIPVDSHYDYLNGIKKDDRSDGYNEIGAVFKKNPINFEAFYDIWETDYNTRAPLRPLDNIMELQSMDFVTSTPSAPTAHKPSSVFNVGASTPTEPLSTPIKLSGTSSTLGNVDFYLASLPTKGTLSHTLLSTPFARNTVSATITYIPNAGQTGADSFTFMVRDGTVNSAPVTVNISINSSPIAKPTANAGNNQSVISGSTVSLDGSGSTDGVTYQWSHTSVKPSGFTFSSTAQKPTFTAPAVSTNTNIILSLIVTKDGIPSIPDTVTITVQPKPIVNHPPVSDAGPNQNVLENTVVTLDGTASTDKDGDSLKYKWTQTLGDRVELSSNTKPKPTFTAPNVSQTTYVHFKLIVNDGKQDSIKPSSVTITILPVIEGAEPNLPLIPNPDSGISANFGNSVTSDNGKIIVGASDKDYLILSSDGLSFFGNSFMPNALISGDVSADSSTSSISPSISISDSHDLAKIIDENSGNTITEIASVVKYDGIQTPTWNQVNALLSSESSPEPSTMVSDISANSLVLAINNSTGYSYLFDGLTANLLGTNIDRAGGAYILDGITGDKIHGIDNPTPDSREYFGWSVSANDSIIAISARDDNTGASRAGTVYLYDYSGKLLHTINNPSPHSSDKFGHSIYLTDDKLIVGAPFDDTKISNAGSVYIYSTSGSLLKTINHDKQGAKFGYSVSASNNGAKILIGADGEKLPNQYASVGAVYVYDTSGNKLHTITNPTPNYDHQHFGRVVEPYGNDKIIIGAPIFENDAGITSGTVFVYDISTGNKILQLINPNPNSGDQFGASISTVDDGSSNGAIVVGTPSDGYDGYHTTGSAFLFNGITSSLITMIENPSSATREKFGTSVGSIGDNIIIGVPDDTEFAGKTGSIYLMTPSDYLPPTANAGADQSVVSAQQNITLDGSASSSVGNKPLTYKWTPTLEGQVTLSSDTSVHPTFTAPTTESDIILSFDLYVNNGIKNSNTDSVTINVKGVTPVDTTPPRIDTITRQNPTTQATSDSTVTFRVTFDEDVTGVDISDFTTGGDATSSVTGITPNSAVQYDVTATVTASGTVSLSLNSGHGITDTATTPNPLTNIAPINPPQTFTVTLPTTPFSSYSLIQKITNPDLLATFAKFGTVVSLDGDTAIIGSYSNNQFGGFGSNPTSIFTKNTSTGTWEQSQRLISGDYNDMFGSSASVSGDTILVGAPGGNINSGTAYIFTKNTGADTWTKEKIMPSDSRVESSFGYSVSIDGDTALVGSYGNMFSPGSGTAYIFTKNSAGTWEQSQKLTSGVVAFMDHFGGSVSIDGDTILVGAPVNPYDISNSGAAYIFTKNSAGTWIQSQKLTSGVASDLFGSVISISGDTILVGAPGNPYYGNIDSGAAYIFTKNSAGTWIQSQKITSGDSINQFGSSASISGDTILVGVPGDESNSGAAYIFTKNSAGTWIQSQKLTSGGSNDQFGSAASISGDTILVGVPGDESNSGAAYIFSNDSSDD